MMTGIEKFKTKYTQKTSLLGATLNGEDGPPKHEESNQSLTARRKKSPGELKLDKLGHTVAENFPG